MSEVPVPEPAPTTTSDYATEPFMAEAAELEHVSLAEALSTTSILDAGAKSIDDYEFFAGNKDNRKAIATDYNDGGVEGVEGLVSNHDYPKLDAAAVDGVRVQDGDRFEDLALVGAKTILSEVDQDGDLVDDGRLTVEGATSVVSLEGYSQLDAEYSRIQLAYLRVTKALKEGEIPEAERDYAEQVLLKQEVEMKKIQMLKAAHTMSNPVHSGENLNTNERLTERQKFMELNESLYGGPNVGAYKGILEQELRRAEAFEPRTPEEAALKADILEMLNTQLSSENLQSVESISADIPQEIIDTMTPVVLEQFKDFIEVWDEFGAADQLTSEQMQERVQAIFNKIGFTDLGVSVLIDESADTINVSGPSKEMRIPASDKLAKYNSDWLLSIVMHEYGHLVRSVAVQDAAPERSMLAKGTPNYLGAEEGFNAFNQIIFLTSRGQNWQEVVQLWQDRYLVYGLARGLDGNERAAFETREAAAKIETLHLIEQGNSFAEAKEQAKRVSYAHTERFFRGSPFSDPGTVYAKDKVYYDGLMQNIPFFAELVKTGTPEQIREAYARLFIGKIDHTNPKELDLVEKYVINKQ